MHQNTWVLLSVTRVIIKHCFFHKKLAVFVGVHKHAYILGQLLDIGAAKYHILQRGDQEVFALCWYIAV